MITDKELLAICNLSNLKMEFANLKLDSKEGTTKQSQNNTNHTIYSLLEQERNSIMDPNNFKRVFIEKNDVEDEEEVGENVYKELSTLKKEAGLVYEYFEKYSLGNTQGEFLNEWEVLGGFDGYELIKNYLESQRLLSSAGILYEGVIEKEDKKNVEKENKAIGKEDKDVEIRKIFIYEVEPDNNIKDTKYPHLRKAILDLEGKNIEKSDLIVTDEEGIFFESNKEYIKNQKLYLTRDEIKDGQAKEALKEKIIYGINLLSFLIPAIGGNTRSYIQAEQQLSKELTEEAVEKVAKQTAKNPRKMLAVKYASLKIGKKGRRIKKVFNKDEIREIGKQKITSKEIVKKASQTIKNVEVEANNNFLNKLTLNTLLKINTINNGMETFTNLAGNYVGFFTLFSILEIMTSKNYRRYLIEGFWDAINQIGIQYNKKTFISALGIFLIDLPFITYNILSEAVSAVNSYELIDELLEEKELIAKETFKKLGMEMNTKIPPKELILQEQIDIMNDGFRVTILKKEKELVICFGNPPVGSKVRENIETENILGETMMMSIIDSLILGSILERILEKDKKKDVKQEKTKEKDDKKEKGEKEYEGIAKDYTVIITGFEYGADLAELYYCTQENLDLLGMKKKLRTFKYPHNNLLKKLYEFDTRDLEVFYRVQASTFGDIVWRELKSYNNLSDMSFLFFASFLRIGLNPFTFLGSVVAKIILNSKQWITEIKNRETIDNLYIELCKNKIFDCSNYEKCLKENFRNCVRTATDTIEHQTNVTLKSNSEIWNILQSKYKEIIIERETGKLLLDVNSSAYDDYNNKQSILLEDYLALKIDTELFNYSSHFYEKDIDGEIIFENNENIIKNIEKRILESKLYLPRELREKKDSLINKYFEKYNEYEEGKSNPKLKDSYWFGYLMEGENYVMYKLPILKTNMKEKYNILIQNEKVNIKKYSKYYYEYCENKNIINLIHEEYRTEENILEEFEEEYKEISKPTINLLSFLEMNRKQKEIIEQSNEATLYYALGKEYDITLKREEKLLPKNLSDLKFDIEPGRDLKNEFYFFPFIDDNGNFSMKTNGETSYYHINERYIGSVFRSIYKKRNWKIDIRYYYTAKEALKFNLITEGEKYNWWDYDKHTYQNLEQDTQKEALSLNVFVLLYSEKGKKLSEILLEEIFKVRDSEYLMRESRIIACKQVLDYLKDIYTQQEYDKLEKYYLLLEIPESQGLKKELRVGHLLPNGEYNEKEIQYVYNDKDDIKRGILVLEGWIPGVYSQGEVQSAELDELVSGATLKCTGGEGTVSFEGVNNKGNTTGGKVIGAETDNKISCFKHCNILDGGCGISTPGNWLNPGSTTGTNGVKNITTKSVIKCEIGGTIYVVKNGVDKVKKSN